QQPFLLGHAPRHLDRIIVGDGHNIVNEIGAQDFGNETRTNALNLVRARLATRQDGTICRFHSNDFEVLLERANVFANAGQCAAGTHAGNQNVDFAIGVVPDFRPGGLAVNFRICRIGKLLQDVAVRSIALDFLGLRHGSLHAAGTGREHQFRAEGHQQYTAFQAHGVRHNQDQLVSLYGSNEGQPDAGVATGRLDQNRLARLNSAGLLGVFNHDHANTVFHAVTWIEALEFRRHSSLRALGHFVEVNQRGAADQFCDILGDLQGSSCMALRVGVAALGSGLWALGSGLWALGSGLWALGSGLWALGSGLWALGSGLCLYRDAANDVIGAKRNAPRCKRRACETYQTSVRRRRSLWRLLLLRLPLRWLLGLCLWLLGLSLGLLWSVRRQGLGVRPRGDEWDIRHMSDFALFGVGEHDAGMLQQKAGSAVQLDPCLLIGSHGRDQGGLRLGKRSLVLQNER